MASTPAVTARQLTRVYSASRKGGQPRTALDRVDLSILPVHGHDVVTQARAVRPLIGLVFDGERGPG